MQKKFLVNIFILLAVNILIKPFWILGIDRLIQNTVGNEQYGVYANLFAFSLLFVMLLDFGINNFSSTSVAKNHSIISKQFSSLVPLKILFSFAYLIVTTCVGMIYGFSSHQLWLLFMMSFNQILSFFILYFRSNISGLQLFKTDSLLSVVDRTLMIIFCGLMIWAAFAEVNIEHFIYAQTLGYIMAMLISFYVLKPYLETIKFTIDTKVFIALIKQAYPFAVIALLMTLYTRVDIILIKKIFITGDIENGIYAKANRLLEASNMMAVMVSGMLLPMFAKMLNQKEELQQLVKMSMAILIAPAIMLSVFCSIYKTEIMELLYHQNNPYASDVFGIVIFTFIPICVTYIFGTLLTANSNLKIVSLIALVAVVVNMAINLFIIPSKGAFGAAIAALITQSFAAILFFVFAQKKLKLQLTYFNVLQFVLFAIIFVTSILFMHQSKINLFISIIISGLSGVTLLFVFRILKYSSLVKLASNNLKGA